MPSQAEVIQALQNASNGSGLDPMVPPPQSPADVYAGASPFANVLGLPDAVKALKGQMTPEEGQAFALTSAMGLLPGAKAEEAALPAARAASRALPAIGDQVRSLLGGAPHAAGTQMQELFPHLYPSGDPYSWGATVGTIRDALNPSHVVARQPAPAVPQVDISRIASHPAPGPVETSNVPGATVPGVRPSQWTDMSPPAWSQNQPPKLNDDDIIRALQDNPGASIFDIAGIPASGQQGVIAKPAIIPSRAPGILGGNDAARALFDKHIAPHMDENTFAQQYFAGMHDPTQMAFRKGFYAPNSMEWEGPLVDRDGDRIGSISREINMDTGNAHHGYLELAKPDQGGGIAKQLLGNQVDLYNKLGLKSVDLFANINVGGYAWAKYGFLPEANQMGRLQSRMNSRLMDMRQQGLDPALADHTQALINSGDPQSIWALSDITAKSPEGDPIGKKLLLGSSWDGKLHLNDPVSMDRFNAYVGK